MVKKQKVQIIVHCKEYEKRQKTIESLGYIKYKLPMIDAYVIEVEETQVDFIKSMDGLISVELDAHITAQMNRVGDIIESHWAHEHGYYGRGVGVAVVDTGIALHKDFIEAGKRVVAFADFLNHRTDPYDDNGHGTHVAYQNEQHKRVTNKAVLMNEEEHSLRRLYFHCFIIEKLLYMRN